MNKTPRWLSNRKACSYIVHHSISPVDQAHHDRVTDDLASRLIQSRPKRAETKLKLQEKSVMFSKCSAFRSSEVLATYLVKPITFDRIQQSAGMFDIHLPKLASLMMIQVGCTRLA